MEVRVWLARNAHLLKDSPFEELFVRNVLTRVRELDFRAVGAQYRFTDDGGRDSQVPAKTAPARLLP